MPTLSRETLSAPKTNILMLSIASWPLFIVFFSILPVNVNTGFQRANICHMQWWEELLFLSHKSRKALKLHRSLVLYPCFCASLLVLWLRVWTINPSRPLFLPKFPIPQTLLPFVEQRCLELHWNGCCGSGCVPVEALQAAGWDRPSWSARPCSGENVLYPRLLTHRWFLIHWAVPCWKAHDKTLITLLTTTVEQPTPYSWPWFNFLRAYSI